MSILNIFNFTQELVIFNTFLNRRNCISSGFVIVTEEVVSCLKIIVILITCDFLTYLTKYGRTGYCI